jgi:hypothetical protein
VQNKQVQFKLNYFAIHSILISTICKPRRYLLTLKYLHQTSKHAVEKIEKKNSAKFFPSQLQEIRGTVEYYTTEIKQAQGDCELARHILEHSKVRNLKILISIQIGFIEFKTLDAYQIQNA